MAQLLADKWYPVEQRPSMRRIEKMIFDSNPIEGALSHLERSVSIKIMIDKEAFDEIDCRVLGFFWTNYTRLDFVIFGIVKSSSNNVLPGTISGEKQPTRYFVARLMANVKAAVFKFVAENPMRSIVNMYP